MRLPYLVPLAAVLAACSGSRQGPSYDPNAVTLCIENEAAGYGNVVAYVSGTRFSVYPGEQVCRDVHGAGGLSVRASTTSGGSMGPLRFAFQLPSSYSCWHWRVSSSSAVDVVPCEQ